MNTRMMFARAVASRRARGWRSGRGRGWRVRESVAIVADLGWNRSVGRPILWYNMRRTDRLEQKHDES